MKCTAVGCTRPCNHCSSHYFQAPDSICISRTAQSVFAALPVVELTGAPTGTKESFLPDPVSCYSCTIHHIVVLYIENIVLYNCPAAPGKILRRWSWVEQGRRWVEQKGKRLGKRLDWDREGGGLVGTESKPQSQAQSTVLTWCCASAALLCRPVTEVQSGMCHGIGR